MRTLAITTTLLTACGSAPTVVRPHPEPPPPEEAEPPMSAPSPDFLERYAATNGFGLGQPASISITPEGDSILFLRSGPRSFVRSLYRVDAATGEESEVLTADSLLGGGQERLNDEERARRERLRLAARGITSFELSRDGRRLLVPLSGRIFVVERATGAVTELPGDAGYSNDPQFSPDGNRVACVRNGDLYVIDVARRTERRLTRTGSDHLVNGLPEFVAEEEMHRYRGTWWSPDSRRLAYQETDTSAVETLYSSDPLHPEQPPRPAAYPRAGTRNASVRLGVVGVDGGPTRWVQWDREAFPYLATVRWGPEGGPLTILVQDRRQQVERLLAVDPATGETTLLLEERDDAWLNLDQTMPVFLGGGERFLWTTERGGAWQVELRARDGSLVRTLTTAELGYERFLHVDEARGALWISASDEPTESHIVRVPLDGGDAVRLTHEPGAHGASFGDDSDLWVHLSEGLVGLPRWIVRRGDAEEVGELRSVAEDPGFVPAVEMVTVGERQLRAQVIRPQGFEPGRRYPVLVSVYGGPHARVVRHSQRRNYMRQWFADHGFVVVSIDGRGTPGRGRAWERAIRGNFIEVPLTDQVDGLLALGERFPELDLDRVGIFGWSFGGYFAAMAVMRRPDVFHAGVAGAPVGDWRDYDTHYTERYLGLPDENEAGYRDSSVITHAPELTRPLLIMHGTSDDNVYFTHAVRMSDALLRAGRHHEFVPLSGLTHMVADPTMTRAVNSRIVDFFLAHLSR